MDPDAELAPEGRAPPGPADAIPEGRAARHPQLYAR
jgi:hypothetical protein